MKRWLLSVVVVMGGMLAGCDAGGGAGSIAKSLEAATADMVHGVGARPDDTGADGALPGVYTALKVEADRVEGGVFSLLALEDRSVLVHRSRSGEVHKVIEQPARLGRLSLDKAWRFDDQHVLVVSSDGNGSRCPSTTYVIGFDTRQVRLTGSVQLDGCSRTLEALAEGSMLILRKEGLPYVFHNGIVE